MDISLEWSFVRAVPPILKANINVVGFSSLTAAGMSEPEQSVCLFDTVYWNIQEIQVYETVDAICAPAFSPPIMVEHKANIRADMCEKCQNRFSGVLCIANLNIAWIA